jgi:CDP-diacylglycerol--glycerol-3-phosphate 3-phosphatidyltransferase
LAASDRRSDVVVLFLVMAVSDWIDGKLAILLDQRSEIGPWLDSVADAAMYVALLVAAVLLEGDRLRSQWPWIAVPIALYLIAGALSLAKFGRWPNHHTRLAKISWGLMLVGAVAFIGAWSLWPLRAAFVGATLASVQSMLITRILPEWRPDVPSLSAARVIRRSG